MNYLTLISGSQAGLRKTVSVDTVPRLLIGQADQCDWVLSDSGVESLHCLIEATRDGVSVIALLGRISVNGQAIDHREPVALQFGDCIDIGGSGVQLSLSEAADSSIQCMGSSQRKKMPIRLPVLGTALIMVGASCYGLVGQNSFSVSQTLPQLTDRVTAQIVTSLSPDEDTAPKLRDRLTLQQAFERSDLVVPEERMGEASLQILERFQQIQPELTSTQKTKTKALTKTGKLIQPLVAIKLGEHPYLTDKKGAVYFLNSRLPNGDLLIAVDNHAYTVQNENGQHRYSIAHLQVLKNQKNLSLVALDKPKRALHFPGKVNSKYDEYIMKASATYGIDAFLIKAVIQTESNFNPQAVSHVGAQGLMQIMPTTAKGLDLNNPFSPEHNIMAGSKLLSRLLNKYEQNQDLALAAYNAGEGAVSKYNGVPPYKETMAYVEKVSQARDHFRNIELADNAKLQLTLKD